MDSVRAFFRDAFLKDGYIWIFDNRIQAVSRISIVDFKIEVVSSFRGVERFIAQKIFFFQDRFYFVEDRSTSILIFDGKEQGKNNGFHLQEQILGDRSEKYTAFFHKGCIWFFPEHIEKHIIGFDIKRRRYFIKKMYKCLPKIKKENGVSFSFLAKYYYDKGIVWSVLTDTGFYLKCDLDNEKADLFQTEAGHTLSNCISDKEQSWLSDGGNVICVGERKVQIFSEQSCTEFYPVEEGLLVFGENKREFVFVEKNNFKVSMINIPIVEKIRPNEVIVCCESSEFVFLFLRHRSDVFVFNKKTLEIRQTELKCENYKKRFFETNKPLLKEAEDIKLEHMLEFCGGNTISTRRQGKTTADAGARIWKYAEENNG